jgi:hypothetical protein
VPWTHYREQLLFAADDRWRLTRPERDSFADADALADAHSHAIGGRPPLICRCNSGCCFS